MRPRMPEIRIRSVRRRRLQPSRLPPRHRPQPCRRTARGGCTGIRRASDRENDGTTERGHIYAVPYLGRIVSSRTTIAIPTDMPSLRASLLDPKFWALAILHTFTNYGLVVLLHNRLEARGFAYNGWGMDRDGYDMKGYSMC